MDLHELEKLLEAFEVVLKVINHGKWGADSFTHILTTLATISAIGSDIEKKIREIKDATKDNDTPHDAAST